MHTCSLLFTPVHNCSHLFTPVHTHLSDYLHSAHWQFFVEFSPCESCYFSILRAILLKLHIWAHLIESYPTVYGLRSCIERKMSIPQAAYITVTIDARRAVIFCTFESSYSSVLRPILLKLHILTHLMRELSNGVLVMALY